MDRGIDNGSNIHRYHVHRANEYRKVLQDEEPTTNQGKDNTDAAPKSKFKKTNTGSKMKKKYNAGDVFYFILRSIQTSVTEDQFKVCDKLIEQAAINYQFVDHLANDLLIRRCEVLINYYPVYE